jgi:glycosyltransferase involved in cell wall biosynthesis
MSLLYDLTAAQASKSAKFNGGAYYAEAVFFALIKRTKNFICIYNSKLYINPKILEAGIKLYDTNQISPKEIIEKENITTFYSAWYKSDNEWRFDNIRSIITWHGFRGLEMPFDNILFYYAPNFKKKIGVVYAYFKKKRSMEKIKNRFSNVNSECITVSEHTKKRAKNFFPQLEKNEIPVFYPPFIDDEEVFPPQLKIEPKKYFLLTSSARWQKNNMRAVWAFDQLFDQKKCFDFKVILTGVTNEFIFSRYIKNKERFILLNFIDRPELLYLHKNAYAFIYPSLCEGFGYPPMESMRYGVPVAASGTSAIPEVCQNAAVYFDPYNVSEIKNRIIQLLDEKIYNEYSARAVERYKTVSEKQKSDLEKMLDYILGEQS